MKIEEIKEQFKDEWVLVEIVKEDKSGTPTDVRLISHNKNKEETNKAMIKHKEKYTYHFYTGKIPEKGYAVVFYDKI